MNHIEAIETDYIRPSRTVETILLTDIRNREMQKLVYVYNYEGKHFRIFGDVLELSNFLNGNEHQLLNDFSAVEEADNYLVNLTIN